MLNQEDLDLLCSALPFWDHLDSSQRELLASGAEPVRFSKGQVIHCGENQCIGVLLIKHGMVRTYITSVEGREVTLYRLESGDICILSASCVLQAIDFDVSVDAETDCEVLRICSHVFSRLTSENVYVELFGYKLATERFSDVMWVMQQILFTSFDKRLAAFLLDEALKNQQDTVSMTHEQIARYLGTAREVVSRMLKYFSKEGLVALSRGDITLLDKNRLRSLFINEKN